MQMEEALAVVIHSSTNAQVSKKQFLQMTCAKEDAKSARVKWKLRQEILIEMVISEAKVILAEIEILNHSSTNAQASKKLYLQMTCAKADAKSVRVIWKLQQEEVIAEA